ncbi:MAG TPA: AraC family transcriptional regulator [Flavisolibacter sp.]|nr:AraC family transcriptional regulator [Flavisolibacter sp.]
MKLMEPGNYFGKTIEKRQVSDFILSESMYHRHCKIPLHSHQNFYLCLVVKGNYSETYSKKNICCSAGDVIIHPNYVEHSNLFAGETGICFNVEVSNLEAKGIVPKSLPHQKLSHSAFTTNIKKVYAEFRQNDPFSSIIIEGIILETIGYFSRNSGSVRPYWIKKAREIASEKFLSKFSLSDIAQELNVTPAHLAREFKKATGYTIGEFLQLQKIQKACELLQKKSTHISDVAEACGFVDHSHFSRVFKKVMKLTPNQYKKML